jgi:hypothetical protein
MIIAAVTPVRRYNPAGELLQQYLVICSLVSVAFNVQSESWKGYIHAL